MAFELEKEALFASGLTDRDLMISYVDKLRYLHEQFTSQVPPQENPQDIAKELFKWLWEGRLFRYQSRGNFCLNKVLDSQLDEKMPAVGNCLGLTLLYNCLLLRMGIDAEALYIENAFGVGPHVLTLLRIGDQPIDVENIFPDGFNYQGHLNHPNRIRWGSKEVVAEIYNSLGNLFFEKGKLKRALKNYDMALGVSGDHEKARLNRLILLDKIQESGHINENRP